MLIRRGSVAFRSSLGRVMPVEETIRLSTYQVAASVLGAIRLRRRGWCCREFQQIRPALPLRNVFVEFWRAETKTIPHQLVRLGMKLWSTASCVNVEKRTCSGGEGDDDDDDDDDQCRTEQSSRQ